MVTITEIELLVHLILHKTGQNSTQALKFLQFIPQIPRQNYKEIQVRLQEFLKMKIFLSFRFKRYIDKKLSQFSIIPLKNYICQDKCICVELYKLEDSIVDKIVDECTCGSTKHKPCLFLSICKATTHYTIKDQKAQEFIDQRKERIYSLSMSQEGSSNESSSVVPEMLLSQVSAAKSLSNSSVLDCVPESPESVSNQTVSKKSSNASSLSHHSGESETDYGSQLITPYDYKSHLEQSQIANCSHIQNESLFIEFEADLGDLMSNLDVHSEGKNNPISLLVSQTNIDSHTKAVNEDGITLSTELENVPPNKVIDYELIHQSITKGNSGESLPYSSKESSVERLSNSNECDFVPEKPVSTSSQTIFKRSSNSSIPARSDPLSKESDAVFSNASVLDDQCIIENQYYPLSKEGTTESQRVYEQKDDTATVKVIDTKPTHPGSKQEPKVFFDLTPKIIEPLNNSFISKSTSSWIFSKPDKNIYPNPNPNHDPTSCDYCLYLLDKEQEDALILGFSRKRLCGDCGSRYHNSECITRIKCELKTKNLGI